MDKLMVRAAEWIGRFSLACHNCGVRSALTMMVVSRITDRPLTVTIKNLDARFTFRGGRDYGVRTHFFTTSVRIEDDERKVRTIIDGGANIGDETIKFKAFHPAATIIAVEADPENFAVLAANFDGDDRVRCENLALWSTSGEQLTLVRTGGPEGTETRAQASGGETIETTSVPDLMARHGFDRLDILKLDIEGAERELFRAEDVSWLDKVDVLITEVADHENPGGLQQMLSVFPEADCTIIGENVVAIRRDSGLTATAYRFLTA